MPAHGRDACRCVPIFAADGNHTRFIVDFDDAVAPFGDHRAVGVAAADSRRVVVKQRHDAAGFDIAAFVEHALPKCRTAAGIIACACGIVKSQGIGFFFHWFGNQVGRADLRNNGSADLRRTGTG